MTAIVITMLVILIVAGAALGFAAYPGRGEKVPGVPWLGNALERAADAVPTIADGDLDPTHEPDPAPPVETRTR